MSDLGNILKKCCLTSDIIRNNVFPWRKANSRSYVLEILRAKKLGFDVGFYIGDTKHGVWLVEQKELKRYLSYLSKIDNVRERYATRKYKQ